MRKYLWLACLREKVSKAELLGSNEALKAFGSLWEKHNGDVMAMLAVVEYEYIADHKFTESEIGAVKVALGRVARFLTECGKEWKEYEESQARKKS